MMNDSAAIVGEIPHLCLRDAPADLPIRKNSCTRRRHRVVLQIP